MTLNEELKDKLGESIEDILIAKKEEVKSMTANISKTIQETFQKTREEGREEGREEEREEERVQLAIEMLRDGEPIEKIAKYSKLSENEILELKKKI